MDIKKKVLSELKNDSIKNALLIRTLENEPDTEFHIYNGSAAVFEKRTGYWLFDIKNSGDFTELIKSFKNPLKTFYVNSVSPFSEIKYLFNDAKARMYIQYSILSGMFKRDPAAVNPDVNIVPLDKSSTEFILSLYKNPEFAYKEYIDACIDINPSFGAILRGEMVGYVLIHLDGEIGPMVISEKARGKGVGNTLMQSITPLYEAQASAGCGFVLEDNERSCHMMKRACFTPLDEKIMWVYL